MVQALLDTRVVIDVMPTIMAVLAVVSVVLVIAGGMRLLARALTHQVARWTLLAFTSTWLVVGGLRSSPLLLGAGAVGLCVFLVALSLHGVPPVERPVEHEE